VGDFGSGGTGVGAVRECWCMLMLMMARCGELRYEISLVLGTRFSEKHGVDARQRCPIVIVT
jgi:hypothetical protein